MIVALLLCGSVAAPAAEPPFAVRVELDPDGDAAAFLNKLNFNVDAAFHDWARVYVNREELEQARARWSPDF